MARQRIGVVRRALIARINRKLAHEGRQLRVARSQGEKNYGAYIIVKEKAVADSCRDDARLEAYARELGVITQYETLAK